MPKYSKYDFPEITSSPVWRLSWIWRVIVLLLFLSLIAIFFILPFIFYKEGRLGLWGIVFILLLYYPILVWGCIKLTQNYKENKKKKLILVAVNKTGLHYHRNNGEIESILYCNLEKSYEYYIKDVDVRQGSRYSPPRIFVHLNNSKKILYFGDLDGVNNFYSLNEKALRAHFIQGISLFRPDLTISESVYSNFYIRKEDYEFDKKNYIRTIIGAIILIIAIIAAIELWIYYRNNR